METPCAQRLSYYPGCSKEDNQGTNKPTTEPQPKTKTKRQTATWCVAQEAVSAKMRGGETGALNSTLALSTSSPPWSVGLHSLRQSDSFLGTDLSCLSMAVRSGIGHYGRDCVSRASWRALECFADSYRFMHHGVS